MKKKRVSHLQGKGSLTHNNRDFIAENVDPDRIRDNYTFVKEDLGSVYERLFAESTERYNAKQKRNDRKIQGSYYESLFHRKPSNTVVTAADKRKSFYEDIVQIGKMEDTACGTPDAEITKQCLIEYMNDFQERNPNFVVFNAVLHMDEATPHLHINYVPVGHYTRGQDTQTGIAQALKEMGFGIGRDAIARWRASEVEILNQICINHDILPLKPEKSRGSMTVKEYKQYKAAEAQRIAEEEKLSELKQQRVIEEHMLKEASSLTTKIKNIDNIETGKTLFGGKVTVSSEEYENLVNLAKRQVADVTKEKKAVKENEQLKKEVAALTKQNTAMSAELDELKKPKPAYISRENLKKQSQKVHEEETTKSKLRKAESFIEACGLYSEYQHYRPNTKNKSYGLE